MGYSFVNLTPPELEERRRQLNLAGFHAWLTPILLLLSISIYRRWLQPSVFSKLASTSHWVSPVLFRLRRISWTLSNTIIPEFGPLHAQLLGLIYFSWLLYLTFRRTGEDYMHVTKSFGHVAISQLPMQYLLALKHPLSPITLATGVTHERLNALHRLFGRMVHALLAAHAVLYLRFFVKLGILPKRIRDGDVRLGVAAFWAFNFLAILALPVVRRRVYHSMFYRSHVILSAVVPVVLFFHVPYTRVYVLQAVVFWALGAVARRIASAKVGNVRCERLEGTELVSVTFEVAKDSPLANPAPGQHVYIRRGGLLGPKTPLTIANVRPTEDEKAEEVQLVVRNLGGPQTSLLAAVGSASSSPVQLELELEGPYGESSEYMPSILEGSSNGPALLIAGGIGATYTLPIYLSLLHSSKKRGRKIKLIWLVKTLADARWGIEHLHRVKEDVDVDVYITTLQPDDDKSPAPLAAKQGLKVHHLGHRPDLGPLIDEIFALGPSNPGHSPSPTRSKVLSNARSDDPRKAPHKRIPPEVTVFVCGPRELSRDVRSCVSGWVTRRGRRVSWFEEVFGFGGS